MHVVGLAEEGSGVKRTAAACSRVLLAAFAAGALGTTSNQIAE